MNKRVKQLIADGVHRFACRNCKVNVVTIDDLLRRDGRCYTCHRWAQQWMKDFKERIKT